MLAKKEMDKRNTKIIHLREKGKTISYIANEVGLSTTRVARILNPESSTKKVSAKKSGKGKNC